MLKIICEEKNIIVSSNTRVADGFWGRMIGLMFSKEMRNFDGLIIRHCNSVHTCFMRYEIDVVFFDKEYRIIKIIRNMKPWRITGFHFRASHVLELVAGNLSGSIHVGDQLILKRDHV